MDANALKLTAKYQSAKQAMIDGYRGLHKAPNFTTFTEVEDLQDKMYSAAVELAEYMGTFEQSRSESEA